MATSYLYRSLLHRLRYKHLFLIASLADTGNLHQAAEILNMSQPAASRMLQEIESNLDCVLFERIGRGMRPTIIGEELIRFARSTLGGLQRCADNLMQWQKGGFGQLVIGTIMGAAPDLVAQAVSEFKSVKPLLRVRIRGETSDQLIELLSDNKVDFAIGRFSALQQHNWLDFEPLGNEDLLLVVRSGHALTIDAPRTLAELAEWPWVLQPISSPARQLLEKTFEQEQISTPKDTVESDSIFAILQLVQRSDAITLLPESVLRDHLRMGLLVALPIDPHLSLPPYGLLRRKGEEISDTGNSFIQILRRVSQYLKSPHLQG